MKKPSKKKLNKLRLKDAFEQARIRDGNVCQICNTSKQTNVHHLISAKLLVTRYLIDNLITLCPLHHRLSHKISGHTGSFFFIIWLLKHKSEQVSRLIEYCNLNMK